MDWTAIGVSVRLAAVTTGALLLIAVPLAGWLAFSRARWKPLVEAAVGLPLVLPPTVLGYYLLTLLGARGPVGAWFTALTGHPLAFTFEGLVVGSVLYSLPFAVQPMAAAFAAVDRRLLETAATLGSSPAGAFWRVTLPLSKGGVAAAAALAFAHTVGEFGVVLMIGGNIPGTTRTISMAIYDDVQALDYAAAGRASLLLLLFSFAALAAVAALRRRPAPP
ncbi:MAG: molybdate ABC transporter permease subunit [Planctomycetes bacterium]|nr:molybdate ABC transporter permease subunit [Planctomycetota bacterium]